MRRPWNRPDLPVYSLSTSDGIHHNMNICTYVTAISMQPKRFIIGVYKDTFTEVLLKKQPKCILQLLSSSQYRLVELLGKQSGHTINKIEKIKNKTGIFHAIPFLTESCAVILCKAIHWTDAGDHYAVLCSVITYRNLSNSPILTTEILREKKIIRA
ncbi:MAG: flavin reductase [Bacteroidia bacterium]